MSPHVSHVSHKMTPSFWGPYSASFKLFFSRPLLYLGIALGYAVYMALHMFAVTELMMVNQWLMYLEIVVSGLIGMLFYMFFVVVALKIVEGKAVCVKEDMKYPFARFKSLIALVLRAGWYVVKWPLPLLILLMLAFAVTKMTGIDTGTGLVKIFSLVFAVGGLVLVLWFMVRSIRLFFVYYVFVAEKADSKVALEHGVDLMKGNWWRMFFFFLGFMVITGIGISVLMGILTMVIPSVEVLGFVMLFIQAIMILLMSLFLAQLYHSFKEFKRS